MKLAGTVFFQIPDEVGGFGVIGKKYEAIKDFLEWNNFDVKEWTPIFVQAGRIYAKSLQEQ